MVKPIFTDIEEIVYNWLVKHKIVFTFQSSLSGGRYELGGSVVDFILDNRNIAIRVLGEYWHRGVAKEGSDLLQKENLSALGWTVVDLLEDDLKTKLEETMRLALLGQEVLR